MDGTEAKQKVDKLEASLKTLESRVKSLESHLNLSWVSPEQKPTSSPDKVKATSLPPTPKGKSEGKVLGIIAAICFVLASAFLIKLAVQSGWLTPRRQVYLAALVGLMMMITGNQMMAKDKEYAGILGGGGIAVLFLSAYGGQLFYGLYSSQVAIIATTAISLLGLAMASSYGSRIMAILAIVGTYLGPYLLRKGGVDIIDLSAFFLLWAIGLSVISFIMRDRIPHLLASYLGMILYAFYGRGMAASTNYGALATVEFLQFLIFSLGLVYHSIKAKTPLTKDESWAYFPALIFLYGVEFHFLSKIVPQIAPWICLGIGLIIVFLYEFARRVLKKDTLYSQDMAYGIFAVIVFHSGYIELIPEKAAPFVVLALVLLAGFFRERIQQVKVFEAGPVILVIGILAAVEYGRVFINACGDSGTYWVLTSGLFAAALLAIYFLKGVTGPKTGSPIFLLMAHLQAIVAIYKLAEKAGATAVSASWGVYALALIAFSSWKKDSILARSSLLVFGVAAAKALVYDVSQSSAPVRIACLFLTGLMLFLGGHFMRKLAAWEN